MGKNQLIQHFKTFGSYSVLVGLLIFFNSKSAEGQNTKGDRPIPNQQQVRHTKAKSIKKKERGTTRDIAGRKLRTKNKSSVSRANSSFPQPNPYSKRKVVESDKAAAPRGPIYSETPRSGERPWKGTATGKPIKRLQPRTTEYVRHNVYPQKGPFVNHSSARKASGKDIAWKGNLRGKKFQARKPTKYKKPSYPQSGRTVNYVSRGSSYVGQPVSNKKEVARVTRMSKSGRQESSRNKKTITPRSVSKPYVVNRRKNVYWGKYTKSEKVITTDIAGRPLRTRNFQSTPIGLVKPTFNPYYGRKNISDRPHKGSAGGFQSSKSGQRAWKGDIAGIKIRKNVTQHDPEKLTKPLLPPKRSLSQRGGRVAKPLPGSGYKSVSRKNKKNSSNPLPSKQPGYSDFLIAKSMQGRHVKLGMSGRGSKRIGAYQGSFKKGTLSPGFSPQGVNYAGNLKAKRAFKGGGSVSGETWNNDGTPIPVRTGISNEGASYTGNFRRGELSPGFSPQGVNFAGNLKARKPLKGGGSVSGKLWNNNGTPIPVRTGVSNEGGSYSGNVKRGELSPGFSPQGVNFAGNLKAKRPLKGGGSVSGKLWNNNGTPIPVRTGVSNEGATYSGNFRRGELSPGFSEQGASYSGNIKRSELSPGFSAQGANYSGNIKRSSLATFSAQGADYTGNIKRSSRTTFSAQGANYSGNLKARKPQIGGGSVSGKLWNNNETPIASRGGGKSSSDIASYTGNLKEKASPKSLQGGDFSGNIKSKKPVTGGGSVSGILWNNKERPLDPQIIPQKSDLLLAKYTDKKRKGFLEQTYVQNPNASALSLKKEKPGSTKAGEYNRTMKMYWSLKHNPNSAEKALKVYAPGKANARITDFQGNEKMRKYTSRNLHPDAKFAHLEENNVKEERTIFTSIKLFWSNLFKKNDTQPDHLKEKDRKPRYDKGEKGLWYY
ncbi:MAG: hypothetical protein HC811_01170 [Flammeovirgaceae bacterium]|nr:hypothetical protein [Flammeovirgaceae bacterium]